MSIEQKSRQSIGATAEMSNFIARQINVIRSDESTALEKIAATGKCLPAYIIRNTMTGVDLTSGGRKINPFLTGLAATTGAISGLTYGIGRLTYENAAKVAGYSLPALQQPHVPPVLTPTSTPLVRDPYGPDEVNAARDQRAEKFRTIGQEQKVQWGGISHDRI